MVWCSGCLTEGIRPPDNRRSSVQVMEVTGYCNCGVCCSWDRGWLGIGSPVVSSGPNKGRPKAVGVTASGTRASYGTIAADTAVLPFGSVVFVPGYGYGRVEDRGGAIKGRCLDLWFSSHEEATRWGRKRMKVRVWLP
jgi:3D (Asp-Asp-Asp) domain-containing protein